MTEQSRSFDTPSRQAAEDRSVIDHLVKTFHDDPPPAEKPLRACQIAAGIRRQWTPESRAMLEMLHTP